MNRDGRRDIVVRGGTRVRSREPPRAVSVVRSARRNQDVDAGDVTGDRRPDLVAASYQGELRVYRQRRSTFSRARIQRTRRGASGVSMADLTRDGRLDMYRQPQLARGARPDCEWAAPFSVGDAGNRLPRRNQDARPERRRKGRPDCPGLPVGWSGPPAGRGTFGGFDIYHAGAGRSAGIRMRSQRETSRATAARTYTAAGGLARGLFVWRQLPPG